MWAGTLMALLSQHWSTYFLYYGRCLVIIVMHTMDDILGLKWGLVLARCRRTTITEYAND